MMNYVKRSFLSLRKFWFRNMVLGVIVTVMGFLLTFSISSRSNLKQLEARLFERLHPVVFIERKAEFFNTENFRDNFLTLDMIESIAELPYIRTYNVTGFLSFDNFHYHLFFPYFLVGDLEEEERSILKSIGNFQPDHPLKTVVGISQPRPIEFDVGIFQLAEGRLITEEELSRGAQVIILPRLFAQKNHLMVGDHMTLEYSELPPGLGIFYERPPARELPFHTSIEVEVVGLFDILDEKLVVEHEFHFHDLFGLYNTPFVPLRLLESLAQDSMGARQDNLEWAYSFNGFFDFFPSQEQPLQLDHLLILYDYRQLDNLQQKVNEILPEGWGIYGTDAPLTPFLAAMGQIDFLSNLVLKMVSVSTFLILILLSLIFVKARRAEIGIYLALGEKKKKIILQLMMELLLVTVVGLILSIFIGSLVVNQFERHLISSEILAQMQAPENLEPFANWVGYPLGHFRVPEITVDDVLSMYNSSLDFQTAILVFGSGLGVVLISALFPMAYILKMKPKKILLST